MVETTTASVFMSGRSQAVRIPKAFWFDTERVEIRKRGKEVILRPITKLDRWSAQREVIAMAKADSAPLMTLPERDIKEGYPRMGFDESREHFEARVQEYEQRSKAAETMRSEEDGE